MTKQEIKQLLDSLPAGMPVLIDEAYHHYVDDPNYATAMPYVNEGRPVVVARTFSKIGAMAALRVGYAVAPTEIIQKMRPFSTGSVNVLARYGATATLKNKAIMEDVKRKTIASRDKTIDGAEGARLRRRFPRRRTSSWSACAATCSRSSRRSARKACSSAVRSRR